MSINSLDELKNDFLIYSAEVNSNRAFPSAQDGLKPSQRAILYTMYNHGYSSNKPHVKCAKVDGATIAELIPHGSEYSTLGRMSQPWVNNICEVDFHGGNGSMLGGPDLAASRYTECRLSEASEAGLLQGLKKDVVDFIPNFSEDLEWPSVLPAIMPRLFVNGSQGIGYTIAQEWEPGNLNEFLDKVKEYFKTGKVTCNDLAPDYPTGGIIINKNDLHNIYETGKGSVVVRAKAEIDGNSIIITELPYQVYAEPLIQKIKDLVNNDEITGIEDICNKSDDNGLLLEIQCTGDKSDTAIVLNRLYKLTDMQVTFSANQMALVDGVPTMLNLLDYIKVYTEHNLSCIKREYTFDLNKAVERQEIVTGLLKAITMLDEIISLIRRSDSVDDARSELVKLGFSENQAKAIVDMRLSKLAHTENAALENENKELTNTIESCTKMIGSESNLKKELIKRLEDFTKKFGWERRTEVTQVDIVREKSKAKSKPEEQYIVAVTKGNYIKKMKVVDFKSQAKFKNESDEIINSVKVSSKSRVILISENGKLYRLPVKKISMGNMNSTGTSLADLVNDKIIGLLGGYETEEFIFFLTNNGLAKKMSLESLFRINKLAGTTVMKLQEGDKIISLKLVNDNDFLEVNVSNKVKKVFVSDFLAKGKSAGGTRAIKLKDKIILEVK